LNAVQNCFEQLLTKPIGLNKKKELMEIILKSLVFNIKGRDVFHLALQYCVIDKSLSILSNLPDAITNKLVMPPLEITEKRTMCDMKVVNKLLVEMARELKKSPIAKKYYYPNHFLENGYIRNTAMINFFKQTDFFFTNNITYFTANSEPDIAHYFYILIQVRKDFGNPNIQVQKIRRQTFEKNLISFVFQNDYVEYIGQIKSFIKVISTGQEPSFEGACDSSGRLLIAFVIPELQLRAY
jgi:hypothetical protein